MFLGTVSRRINKFQHLQSRLFCSKSKPIAIRSAICPNDLQQFEYLSSEILPKLKKHIANNEDTNIPISTNKSFDELKSLVHSPETLPHEPLSNEDLISEIDLILNHSPRSAKARFCDKLYCGSDSITQFATLLLSVINNNTHTFKAAQILNVIEHITIKNLCKVFYKQDCEPFGGVFMPGGAYSNMIAVRLARDKYFPMITTHGIGAETRHSRPIILTSDQSHYSMMTAGAQVGIGTNNILKLETHDNGTIDIDKCEQVITELIDKHYKPFMLCCVAGTTVLGAFDDFVAVHSLCRKYDIWMHVDGCWGGAVAFCRDTDQYLHGLVDGIEHADSISFDAHKLLSTGLLCGCLLVKDEAYLFNSCAPPNAKYLFHGDSNDIGLKTLQCGRQCDALKLYLNWLYYGKNGLCLRVENAMENAQYLCELIRESDDFILVQDPAFCNVCFWFVGSIQMDKVRRWKDCGFDGNDKDIVNMLETSTKTIHYEMEQEATTALDHSPCKHLPTFFRMITSNYRLDKNEVPAILDDIRRAAAKIHV